MSVYTCQIILKWVHFTLCLEKGDFKKWLIILIFQNSAERYKMKTLSPCYLHYLSLQNNHQHQCSVETSRKKKNCMPKLALQYLYLCYSLNIKKTHLGITELRRSPITCGFLALVPLITLRPKRPHALSGNPCCQMWGTRLQLSLAHRALGDRTHCPHRGERKHSRQDAKSIRIGPLYGRLASLPGCSQLDSVWSGRNSLGTPVLI